MSTLPPHPEREIPARSLAKEFGLYGLSGLGALLYVFAGSGFAIDQVLCGNWPPASTGWVSAGLFLLALVAMALAWLALFRGANRPGAERGAWGRSLIAALLVHAVILFAPPFLSADSLAYGAIGSLVAHNAADMYAPLGALPAGDAYRQLIGQYPVWLAYPSTYGPLSNVIAGFVALLVGDNVRLALKLFQLIAGLAIFATGLLTAAAVAAWADGRPERGDVSALRLAAFRLVVFSPLALIEATGNAHNDALLALVMAGFALAMARHRVMTGWGALLFGLLVKFSAVLPIGFEAVRQAGRLVLGRSRRWTLVLVFAAAGVGLGLLVLVWPLVEETASTVVRLLAPPDGGAPLCTRSLECVPRWLLHFVFDWPAAAWLVGLVFRAGGIALMLVMALRSRRNDDALPALAAFILFYYLFFHAYMQAWYLLSLLVLLVFLPLPLQAVAVTFMLSSLAQYGFDFAWSCSKEVLFVIAREIGGLITVLVPPVVVLLIVWSRNRKWTGGNP